MAVNLIVAKSNNNVIGVNNTLPWKLSSDLKRFKELTTHHTVIMGRKTFESIGKVLPNRQNIVITSNKDSIQNKDILIASSLEHAISMAGLLSHSTEIFVIGGGQVYKEAIEKDLIDKMFITIVDTIVEGDTHFFKVDSDKWVIESFKEFWKDEKNEFNYSFIDLIKK